jgi:pyridoxine kinase
VVISSLPIGTALEAELREAQPFWSTKWSAQPCDDKPHTNERLLCVASSAGKACADSHAVSEVSAAVIPCITGYFSGVGDLFSALMLAHFEPGQGSSVVPNSTKPKESTSGSRPLAAQSATEALHTALAAALATTQAILISTHEYCASLPTDDCPPTDDENDAADPERRVRRMRARELRIVQGLDVIRAIPDGLVDVVQWNGFWGAHL